MDFISLISKKLNSKYDYLKVVKVVYNTTFSICHINFIYPEDKPTLQDAQKNEIKQVCQEVLNLKGKLECKFNKSYLDENIIKNKINEYFKTDFDSISSCIDISKIAYKRNLLAISLEFNVNSTLYKYFQDDEVCDKLKKYLQDNFCGEFVVTLSIDNSDDFNEEELETRAEQIQSKIETKAKTPRYKVENVNIVFGSDIMPMPEYIENLKTEKISLILSGVVEGLEQKEFLPRRNKVKGIDEKRKMYKFKLNDGTGKVNCVHFCTKNSEKHFILIEEGTYILCLGDYVKRDNGEMQYMIKSISLCKKSDDVLLEDNKEEVVIEQNSYKYVKPKPYIRMIQDNLFTIKKEYPDYIMNNTFVVFDVETTGLIPDKNEITEIGAVKIVKGEIVESFQSLCKPHQSIPAEITKLTGIDDKLVENEHSPEEIIEDFLLFCDDCIMVGYNVNFDYQFIQITAQKVNKNFDNEFRDCMGDAKAKLFLPNYKLGTVVDHLGVNLNNAHRALHDATATAEAFLKLSIM